MSKTHLVLAGLTKRFKAPHRRGHPFLRPLLLALMLGCFVCPCLNAFSLLDFSYGFSPSLTTGYWYWPEPWPKKAITYSFTSDFSAAFSDPVLKDEIRQVFRQWGSVNLVGRGSRYTFSRGGGRNFEDIRSISLHEIGHVLGLNHPDQAAKVGLNFVPSGGSYVAKSPTGGEVMTSSLGTGSYNRLLSFDELDAYDLIYGSRDLEFVEVPESSYADILIYTMVDPNPLVVARGAPDCLCLPPPFGPIPASYGRLTFSVGSSTPIGIQTLGMNWRIKSSTGKATRAITVQTIGTDDPAPIRFFKNSVSPLYEFDSFETTLLDGVRLENEFHTWNPPRSG